MSFESTFTEAISFTTSPNFIPSSFYRIAVDDDDDGDDNDDKKDRNSK